MAIAQRFENYGSRHPRMTFAVGLTAGATAVTGFVLAAALTVGFGESVETRATTASVTTNEQAYAAEQDYRTARGITGGVTAASSISDEQSFIAEEGYRRANGIGITATTAGFTTLTPELSAGMDGLIPGHRFASKNSVEPQTAVTPELSAGMSDVVSDHRFALGGVSTAQITVTPELRAGVDDLVPGHPFAWVTPELRAGVEG